MIKIENDMLVLDNTFTKEDVQAIDEFVKINVDRERKRILDLLEDQLGCSCGTPVSHAIALIKNFGE
jgi:hypothetical protein